MTGAALKHLILWIFSRVPHPTRELLPRMSHTASPRFKTFSTHGLERCWRLLHTKVAMHWYWAHGAAALLGTIPNWLSRYSGTISTQVARFGAAFIPFCFLC